MPVSGDQIAAAGERYAGQGYVYGGTASRPGLWDCSSFISYVLGHDLKLSLPGGKWGAAGFPPNSHGPVVTSYASWRGAMTVGSPARGDLVCFVGEGPNGHIGIVLGPDRMVSALDSASGTLVSPITGYGPPGAPIIYRRVLGAAAGSGGLSGIGAKTGGDQPDSMAAAGMVLLLIAGMGAAILAAAALIGTGVAIAGGYLASRMAGNG